ncbi:DUF4136 domain-containing protein [Comamonas jiangduensis]|uniref:DUF4136 domain-containing protein n=1 Tax=Comamonas jiangduensis TaxID=1194168 RepID=UPI003BF7E7DF
MNHLPPSRRWACAALIAGAALLAGCASGPREITSSVQSYSSMAGITLPATYRMELLPSQSQQQSFAKVEAAAEKALQRVGLTRDPRPDLARLVVQVGANASQGRAYHPAYDEWFYGPRFGFGMGWGGPRVGMGMQWMDTPPMVYYRGVKLVLRDQQSQKIVYETSAAYDEVWMDDNVIWNILFDAALSDFPHPPQGSRTVRTTLTPLATKSPNAPAGATPSTTTPAVTAPAPVNR